MAEEKLFNIINLQTNANVEGESVPLNRIHGLITVAHRIEGKPAEELEVNESCIYKGHTRDSRYHVKNTIHHMRYRITRIK